MQYVITRQIAVEAETPEEAVAKIAEGNTISLSVNPRPQGATPGMVQSGTFSRTSSANQPPQP